MNDLILHVEDDPNDVMLVGMAFRKAQLETRLFAATDGDQAVHYLAGDGIYADRTAHPLPALVLLDLKLPRKSGLEVLGWLRAQSHTYLRRVPVVMLTSSNQPDDIDAAYDLGVNSYLVKPGDLRVLVEMVKSLHQYWFCCNARPGAAAPVTFSAGETLNDSGKPPSSITPPSNFSGVAGTGSPRGQGGASWA
ncbi:MAG: response regulator [Pedosphaera sp.]|nr:response regulator [Pedosphaera sp.]